MQSVITSYSIHYTKLYEPVWADKPLTLERLKVAYVFNFIKFTRWPQLGSDDRPLHLCLANVDGDLP